MKLEEMKQKICHRSLSIPAYPDGCPGEFNCIGLKCMACGKYSLSTINGEPDYSYVCQDLEV